ncbi:hypothetical protein E2C01_050280 [Portunus trituberculatus]|uniref:Uncharacterized protein n=1 Tax=Portunus trituberculatus TaxID=210409 RepID=A0A5B7GFG8_PORTR|nr:hypothetical protein [Portunus trituberculatus]
MEPSCYMCGEFDSGGLFRWKRSEGETGEKEDVDRMMVGPFPAPMLEVEEVSLSDSLLKYRSIWPS